MELANSWCRTGSRAGFIPDGWKACWAVAIAHFGRVAPLETWAKHANALICPVCQSIRGRKGQELAVEGVCTASLRIARGYRGQLCCRSEAPRHGLANHRAFRAHSLASKPGDGQLCHVLFGICAANFMCTQMLQETARLEWQSGEPHLAHESPIAL